MGCRASRRWVFGAVGRPVRVGPRAGPVVRSSWRCVVGERVEADRDVCVGAGMCVMTAGAVFDQDDDGIVVVLEGEPGGDDAARARDAVAYCPSGALRLVTG